MKQNEEDEQAALFEYASWQQEPEWGLMFSIPNGGFRSKRTGAKMKRTGLKAGVPDLYLPVARDKYFGMFIEMKSEKGRVQPNQAVWIADLKEQGYRVEVCYGCEAAINTINDYLNGKDPRSNL